MMPDREKVIKELEEYRDREFVKEGITVFDNDPRYRKLIIGNALALLKEQEAVESKTIPEELKQKIWNALYAEEDKFEEKYIGTDKHDAWFDTYRPWLQRGFEIAIEAIADFEGR